ncbi:MAG: hypothetical protein KKA42_13325 [candidate division Zixibacteria bacterium]|nr:hypothetical protein [candidate division Zixibacteria bacterium]
MIHVVEMILMGVPAILVMDMLAMLLVKARIIRPPVGPEAVGRWILCMFRLIFTTQRHYAMRTPLP